MCKLLLLEKDETIRMLYRWELEAWGYSVVDTDKPEIFLKMITEDTPDVIVMEAGLTEWNGCNLLQRIRNRYDDLPIILCIRYPYLEGAPKSFETDSVVVKGFDLGELRKGIRMSLNLSGNDFDGISQRKQACSA